VSIGCSPFIQADLDLLRRNLGECSIAWVDDADLLQLYEDAGSEPYRATLLGFLRIKSSASRFQAYASAHDPSESLALREAVEASYQTWLAWCQARGLTGIPLAEGTTEKPPQGAGTLELVPPRGGAGLDWWDAPGWSWRAP
jgi:hypothetical protein